MSHSAKKRLREIGWGILGLFLFSIIYSLCWITSFIYIHDFSDECYQLALAPTDQDLIGNWSIEDPAFGLFAGSRERQEKMRGWENTRLILKDDRTFFLLNTTQDFEEYYCCFVIPEKERAVVYTGKWEIFWGVIHHGPNEKINCPYLALTRQDGSGLGGSKVILQTPKGFKINWHGRGTDIFSRGVIWKKQDDYPNDK